MDGPSGRVSALWDTEMPFTIGQPLRWVVEFEPQNQTVRLIDTRTQKSVEKKVLTTSKRAQFELSPQSSITLWQETALTVSPQFESRTLGSEEQAKLFKTRAMQSVAALAVIMLVPLIAPKPRKMEVVAQPVQVMQLVKNMAPKPVPQTAAAAMASKANFSSRLKSFVAGSASRWLAATSFNSFSGAAFNKFTAAFGNGNTNGAPQLQGGLSQSAAAGGGGLGSSKDWVNLDTFAATVQEGLTKDEVGEVIHKHMKEVRYCYESAMMRAPDLEGKLVVAFTIGRAGSVKTSAVSNTTIADARMNDCVLTRLAGWKFPQPKGGVEVAVSYPFLFKTLGK